MLMLAFSSNLFTIDSDSNNHDHDDYHDSDVPLSGASVGSDALTRAKEGSDFGGTRTI